MGRAPAVLTASRAAALGALLAALCAWDAFAHALPAVSDRWDVAVVAAVLLPATFAVVWLLLPIADARGLFAIALATAALAVLLHLADLTAAANVAKLVTFALVGFWFLQLFEALSWVVLVAVVIPWVDIASVYRGPTRVVVEEEPGLFEKIAVSFAIPGEKDAAARLGPPDVLFFALFLATAARFDLRVAATWVGMTGALVATLVATYAFDLNGLPGLPAIALGFLVPNADLLWRALRARDEAPRPGPDS
ncbi:MAG TPA: hypothetical protein VJM07_11780 [Gaiella sp.]|nr:hypothetical protein [Gaiella sp.]